MQVWEKSNRLKIRKIMRKKSKICHTWQTSFSKKFLVFASCKNSKFNIWKIYNEEGLGFLSFCQVFSSFSSYCNFCKDFLRFSALNTDKWRKSFPTISSSANNQLRHMRICVSNCMKTTFFVQWRSAYRVSNINKQPCFHLFPLGFEWRVICWGLWRNKE